MKLTHEGQCMLGIKKTVWRSAAGRLFSVSDILLKKRLAFDQEVYTEMREARRGTAGITDDGVHDDMMFPLTTPACG